MRPKILEDVGFDIYVDTSKLRDLPLSVTPMNIDDLIWCFELPVWEKDGTDDWNLTPREVIEKAEGTSEHVRKVEDASLDYPIVVIQNKDKWVILDGVHRLVKAYMLGHTQINAKVLDRESGFYKNAVK